MAVSSETDLVSHKAESMQAEVLAGLRKPQKTLPAKYFYDDRGAKLFEAICDLPEYYPTRTELAILQQYAGEMAAELGDKCLLIEPGSGAGTKARLLLQKMQNPAGFVPIDVAAEQLVRVAQNIHDDLEKLPVYPVTGDFSQLKELPHLPEGPRAIFFPGSTIGNFSPDDAVALLTRFASWASEGDQLLIGVDLVKPVAELEAAYNDAAGVTAEFNLNMLRHINREVGCDFDLSAYTHQAPWVSEHGAIRMELVSLKAQSVWVGSEEVTIEKDEAIHTEYSHKYTVAGFESLLTQAGWLLQKSWQDSQQRFAVFSAVRL